MSASPSHDEAGEERPSCYEFLLTDEALLIRFAAVRFVIRSRRLRSRSFEVVP